MNKIVLALTPNETISNFFVTKFDAELGEMIIRKFPDEETYVQVKSNVKNKEVIILCTLDKPDGKILPLYFLVQTLKEMDAKSVCLVSPYLAYMRQDKQFNGGEAVSSKYFANFLSSFIDSIITIDPHLHRRHSLSEIYSVPCKVEHAYEQISAWILNNVNKPVLIGPDSESEQWVSKVAKDANAPFIILEKKRHSDYDVEVSVPDVEKYLDHTPILVDDIISTAKTMIETVQHIEKNNMKKAICIGIHAVFSNAAFEELKGSYVEKVITCNTISHVSNEIDISRLLGRAFDILENKN